LLGEVLSGQWAAMRVVVTGATGNGGTSVLRALSADPAVDEIVAVGRRSPGRALERSEFVCADVTTEDLTALFAGADAVVHLAWLIQPGRDEALTRRVNVDGTRRVCEAVVAIGVDSPVWRPITGSRGLT
jgi:UDP-glucose 4-epimerase